MTRLLAIALALVCVAAEAAPKQKGVAYAHSLKNDRGYGSASSLASLKALKALGANAVSITPFGFQRSSSDLAVRWFHNGAPGIDETDERVVAGIRQAHQVGLSVMMKPHIWLRPPDWPGSIEHSTDEAWSAWFASYSDFILHYARMAQAERVEWLCIGNELQKTSGREVEWRRLIAAVRSVYRGKITYGANFEEVEKVPFWKEVDAIGVSAYFLLVEAKTPSVASLRTAWRPLERKLAALSTTHGRPVIFTEIGYRSADGAAWKQWEIARDAVINATAQKNAYEAFFLEVWPEKWLAGAYLWKWESYVPDASRGDNQYAFEGKPAEKIVRKFYRGQ
jgi:hypothetical protein